MFDKDGKDNTQQGEAKSLCKSCRFRSKDTVNDYCMIDREFRRAVGICHIYYPEEKKNAGNKSET